MSRKTPSDGSIETETEDASKAKEKEKEQEEETKPLEVGVTNDEGGVVMEKEEINAPRAVSEDSRKLEDSVVVINRQAEVEEKENKVGVVCLLVSIVITVVCISMVKPLIKLKGSFSTVAASIKLYCIHDTISWDYATNFIVLY